MNRPGLMQLAAHLEAGRLFHKWNFSTFRALRFGETCGCAVSELSRLAGLQDLETTLAAHDVSTVDAQYPIIQKEVRRHLDLTKAEFNYLFIPNTGRGCTEQGRWLTEDASPKEVAGLIRHYLTTGRMLERSDEETKQLEDGEQELTNNPFAAEQA